MTRQRFNRKIRSVNVDGKGGRRIDITLPEEVLTRAGVKVGDMVEIRASAKRIVLLPLRPDWPAVCGIDGCVRVKGHEHDHITEEEVSY